MIAEDVRDREGEVLPDEIVAGVAEEDPEEDLQAQPAILGVDPVGRQAGGFRRGAQQGEHGGAG